MLQQQRSTAAAAKPVGPGAQKQTQLELADASWQLYSALSTLVALSPVFLSHYVCLLLCCFSHWPVSQIIPAFAKLLETLGTRALDAMRSAITTKPLDERAVILLVRSTSIANRSSCVQLLGVLLSGQIIASRLYPQIATQLGMANELKDALGVLRGILFEIQVILNPDISNNDGHQILYCKKRAAQVLREKVVATLL
jgi:hypothetical protein